MRKHMLIAFATLATGQLALSPASAAHAEATAQAAGTLEQDYPETIDAKPKAQSADEANASAAEPAAPAEEEAAPASPLALADAVARALRPHSEAAMRVTDWVIASGDNGGLPFIVIDKVAATVAVFDAQGEILGETPALLGAGVGDDSTPGIGERAFSEMGPEERTTPAGRFQAEFGPAVGGHTVLWVDYGNSVALHAVVSANRSERRLQRLQSPTAEDNRITYGCINVPERFFTNLVRPLFGETGGIVYVLPDTRALEDVFPRLQVASNAHASAAR